ncbi:ABC transporter substrate-binding protein [Parablautia intestinalis]|uniref:ABC transporter substrate-binding protein n=1 Tax=Parablautia intestinalis TaxID=2320100 RepID=UPI00256F2B72|nr:ABC transporter substrate-binding protein [Parablautia intestinalis]
MKAKKIIAMIMALAAAGCMAGCGETKEAETVETKVAEESTEVLNLWTRGNETDATGPYLLEAVKKYEEKTGIKVNVQFIAFDDAETKWNSAFASGTAPDIIDMGIVHIAGRVNLQHIIPLDEYYESWGNKDQLIPAMKDLGTYNGKLYAIAHFPDPQIFVYRKDMFKEAGLDESRAPESWEELLEYAQKLTIKDENGEVTRAGMAVPTVNARFLASILIHQNGAAFADEDKNLPTFDTPEAVETIEFLDNLHDYSTVFENGNWSENPFLKDNAAMAYVPNGILKDYLKEKPDMREKIGMAACVPGKETAAWCGVWFHGITSQSKNPEQAFDLLSYLTSEEVLSNRVESAGLPSAFRYNENEYVGLDPEVNQAVMDAIACGYGNPKVSWAPIYEKVLDQLTEEVFYDVKTPEEALKDAQESLMSEIE